MIWDSAQSQASQTVETCGALEGTISIFQNILLECMIPFSSSKISQTQNTLFDHEPFSFGVYFWRYLEASIGWRHMCMHMYICIHICTYVSEYRQVFVDSIYMFSISTYMYGYKAHKMRYKHRCASKSKAHKFVPFSWCQLADWALPSLVSPLCCKVPLQEQQPRQLHSQALRGLDAQPQAVASMKLQTWLGQYKGYADIFHVTCSHQPGEMGFKPAQCFFSQGGGGIDCPMQRDSHRDIAWGDLRLR